MTIDHPLATLFPMMSAEEIKTLAADIKENGLREAIIVHEGMILDGRNRYRACTEIGIEPMTRPWDGKGDPLSFVVSKNLHRRHLDTEQRAMVAAKIANMRRGDTLKKGPVRSIDRTGVSNVEAAALMNVSEKSVRRARIVLDKGAPELQSALEAGAVSVTAAAAVAYKLDRDEQREVVSQGPAAVVKAAKAAKHDGPKLSVVAPIIAPQKTVVSGSTIAVPDGVTLEEHVRKGMALEASGMAQPKVLKEIGTSERAYRYVRDLIVLLDDEIALAPADREAVASILSNVNQTKQLCGQDIIDTIVRRVWGSQGTPHTIKAARKRVDHFATVVGIAVQSCANLLLDEFEIPYLTEAETRRWIGELEQARRTLDTFLRTLRSAA